MRKHIKLFVFITSIVAVFLIYNVFYENTTKINYIALGDSITEGMNPYGNIGYGYSDYIKDYLEKEKKLSFYTKGFSKSGYTTEDVINDIENNKTITIDNKKINIKQALRESDLVTISIGANDFLKGVYLNDFYTEFQDIKKSKKEIDTIGLKVKKLMKLIKGYAKNEIILVGYYNPFPRIESIKDEMDELIKYSNNIYEEICEELDITFVNIFDKFDENKEFLPNPLDLHPNIDGYRTIANEIIKKMGS